MVSALYGVIAVGMTVGFVVTARLALRHREPALVLLLLILIALMWDNVILAIGSTLGPGPLLESLSIPRFVTHALFTPLNVLFGVILATWMGVRSMAGLLPRILAAMATLLLIAIGTNAEVIGVRLEPVRYADSLRYAKAVAAGPPVAAIATIVILIGIGIAVWVRARWPWLAVGALAMFVCAAVGAQLVWVQNIGELALMVGLVVTTHRALTTRRVPVPA